MKRSFYFIVALCATLVLAMPVAAQPAQVELPQVISPGGGTRFYHAEFNPQDANNIAIGTDMSATYTTQNDGTNWEIKNVLSTAYYAFNPHDANIVYALGSYLWVSHDKGKTFEMLYPKADKITGIRTGLGEGGNYLFGKTTPENRSENEAAVPGGNIRSLVVDPGNPNLMYFVTYAVSNQSLLYKSTDGGDNWVKQKLFGEQFKGTINSRDIDGYAYYEKLFIQPNTHKLYLINNTGFYELGDDGTVIEEVKNLNYSGDIYWDGSTLHAYLVVQGGVAHSSDYGKNWNTLTATSYTINRIAAANTNTLYATADKGILTSKDGGVTWTLSVNRDDTRNSVTEHHWIEWYDSATRPNLGWLGNNQWMTACQSDPNRAIFSTAGNAFITRDGGATWQDLSSVKEELGYRTTGLDCLNVYDYDVDPFDPAHQLLSATDCGLFESFDSGATWNRIKAPINDSKYANTAYSAVFDPDIQGVFWVAYCGAHDLHLGRNIRGVCNSVDNWKDNPEQYSWTNRGGIACRVNGAWSYWSGAGIPEYSPIGDNDGTSGLPYKALMTDIVVDPLSPKELDKRILYANAMGYGVYKSVDGGKTWAKFNGIMQTTEQRMTTWRLAWNSDYSRLYVVFAPEGSASTNLDFIDYHPAEGAVYYLSLNTVREGSAWTKIKSMPVASGVTSTDNYCGTMPQSSVMAFNGISIAQDGTLYAAGRARSVNGSDYNRNFGGVWMTKDDGATWTTIFPTNSYVTDVKVDSRNNNRLYIATLDGGKVLVSDKGDQTTANDWTELPNFNFKHPQRIVEDPQDEHKFYVTTFAGGVWRMPVPVDDETGMGEVIPNQPALNHAKAGIYTLNGVRIRQATAPGIYVIDGKKTLIKKI
ncbi:MAG: hypothetical protein LBN93_03690 [Candidatus Symbiothrix sp.]|jgi:photosystem II stability/assembly factor-like uncharacterized protein|nr:hypothetical protein [Candidatus Symbiothrix sp.]